MHAMRHGLPDAEMWLNDAQKAAHELQDIPAAHQASRYVTLFPPLHPTLTSKKS